LKMPETVVATLRHATQTIKRNPEFIQAVEKGGYTVDMINEVEFGDRIAREYALWQDVVAKGNIKPE